MKKWIVYIFAGLYFLSAGCIAAAETTAGDVRTEAQDVITLQEGLTKVTFEAHQVKIAGEDEAIFREDTHMVRSGLLPRITASGTKTALSTQPAVVFGNLVLPESDRNYFSYNFTIQQLLFDFNGTLSKYQASRSLLEARKFDSARVRNGLALEFTIDYFDVLEAKKLIGAAEKEVERVQSHLRDAESLYSAGVMTKNDMLQAQVRLSDARQRLLSTRNLRDVRLSRLSNLLLIPLDRKFDIAEYEKEIGNPAALEYEKIWKAALARRPEIRIADKTIESVEFDAISKRAEFLPKAFARVSNDYMENPYLYHRDNWAFVAGININLFEGGRSLADYRKSVHQKQRLIEQRASLADEIKLEVKRYLLDLQNAFERIQVNRGALGQAQENLRINRSRYEAGVGTATEVLDAVTLSTVAETNHIRSVYDYMKSEAAVSYAAGENFLDLYRK